MLNDGVSAIGGILYVKKRVIHGRRMSSCVRRVCIASVRNKHKCV